MGMGAAGEAAAAFPLPDFPEPVGGILHLEFRQIDVPEAGGIHNVAASKGQQLGKPGGMPAPADFAAYMAGFQSQGRIQMVQQG